MTAITVGDGDVSAAGVRATLRAVAARGVPHLVEATVIPTAMFYLAWFTVGRWGAFAAALAWAYAAAIRRVALRRRIPGVLVLALVALTVRTCLAVATGSTFVYFFQPVLGTCAIAAVFFGSALTTRPLVARLAGDFFPLTPEIAGRRRVRRLFRQLTFLWAAINLVNAAAALVLLVTLPVTGFVAVKTVAAFAITGAGIAVTVAASVRVARHEGLIVEQPATAVAPA